MKVLSLPSTALAFALVSKMEASAPDLVVIPDVFPLGDKHILYEVRRRCEAEYGEFKRASDHLKSEGAEQQTDQEAANVTGLMNQYAADATAFNKAVAVEAVEVRNRIDQEIEDTRKQLTGLGFRRAIVDSTGFAGQTERAKQERVGKLIAQLADYATSMATDRLQEHFLKNEGSLSDRDVTRLADQMGRLGMESPLLQAWARAFPPNSSRKERLAGTAATLSLIHRLSGLTEAQDGMDRQTIRRRQEAALTLIPLLIDCPGLNELKAVATGACDAGEAWATLVVLEQGAVAVSASTEQHLRDEMRLVKRINDLADERKPVSNPFFGTEK